MVKFLNKKEISAEGSPIMLQRRHTVMEADEDCNLKEPKLKFINRSSSTSGMNQTRNTEPKEITKKEQTDTTLSPEGSVSTSNTSTVVITESELSSSWLYNNKKAQIKTSPVTSNFTSSSRLEEMNDEMRSPMLPKSKMKSTSMISGQRKKSSCCCYALIILIIAVATLGILAAIASILYFEFFASHNSSDIQISTTISQESVPLKKIGHSLGEENQNILNHTKLPGRNLENVLYPESSTRGSEKGFSNEKQSYAINGESKKSLSLYQTDSSSIIIDDFLNLTSQMINSNSSNQKGILNPINALSSRNHNLESRYSKLLELYKGLHSSSSSDEKSIKLESNKAFSQTPGLSNLHNPINDPNSKQRLKNDNVSLDKKNNFNVKDIYEGIYEIPSELNLDSSVIKEDYTKDIPEVVKDLTKNLSVSDETVKDPSVVFEDTNNFFDAYENVTRDLTFAKAISTNLPTIEDNLSDFKLNNIIEEDNPQDFHSIPPSNSSKELLLISKLETNREDKELDKQLPQLPEDKLETLSLFRTLDINFEEDKIRDKQSKLSDFEQPLANLPITGATNISTFLPNFLSRLGFSNFLRNPNEALQNGAHKEQISADEAESVDLNLPILDSNVAVPRPIEMTKMDDEKNIENDLTQQDRQISLAKVLDRLRLLDANNVIPSSRQSKEVSQKKIEEPNFPSNEEAATERSHYLENLRKKLFISE